jgi:hypothetical protein
VNPQLVTSQERAVGTQSGAATKRGPGRPILEESAKFQEERKVTQESKREEEHEGYQMIINFGEE